MNAAPSTNATTSRLTVVVSYGVLLLLIYLVFRIAEPFLKALAWAAVLVTFFYPMHKRLAKRLSATRASAISTFAVTILLIAPAILRSEEHTSELQSRFDLVCRLLLEKKKIK